MSSKGRNITINDIEANWVLVSIDTLNTSPSKSMTLKPSITKLAYQHSSSSDLTPSHLLPYKSSLIAIDPIQGIFQQFLHQKHKWTKITDFPQNFPGGDWTVCINDNKIYITIIQPWDQGGIALTDDETISVAIYDISNKSWDYDPKLWEKSTNCIEFQGPLSIQFINDKLHIIDTPKGSHSVFDPKTRLLHTIKDEIPFIQQWDNIIYFPSLSKLFSIGYNHNRVQFTKVPLIEANERKFEWEQFKIINGAIPKGMYPVLINEELLMLWPIWETMDRSVWFLNVNVGRLYKSDKILGDFDIDELIKTEDDYLHGINRFNDKHIKIDLFEILPDQLMNSYIDRIDKLVAGYFRFYIYKFICNFSCFNKNKQMPHDLLHLIKRFSVSFILKKI